MRVTKPMSLQAVHNEKDCDREVIEDRCGVGGRTRPKNTLVQRVLQRGT
jgi:hypothetical protein